MSESIIKANELAVQVTPQMEQHVLGTVQRLKTTDVIALAGAYYQNDLLMGIERVLADGALESQTRLQRLEEAGCCSDNVRAVFDNSSKFKSLFAQAMMELGTEDMLMTVNSAIRGRR